jgi:hypothetical protein
LQVQAIKERLYAWDRLSNSVHKDFCNIIEGQPVDWLRKWFPLPTLLFGTHKITEQTKEKALALVQPTLDDFKGKIAAALDLKVKEFVDETFFQKMGSLGNDFNDKIAVKTQQIINEFKQYPKSDSRRKGTE